MVWFLILVSSYLGFLLLRSRLSVLSRLALDSVHLLDGLLEAGDDDKALEELEDRTSKVLVSLLLLLALALAVVVVCAALPWAWGELQDDPDAMAAFGLWPGIVALSIGGTLSFVFPKWKAPEGAYSPLDQLLHRIALDHPTLHRWLHDCEVRRWRKRAPGRRTGPRSAWCRPSSGGRPRRRSHPGASAAARPWQPARPSRCDRRRSTTAGAQRMAGDGGPSCLARSLCS